MARHARGPVERAAARDALADVARDSGCEVELDVRLGPFALDVVLRRGGPVAGVDLVGPGATALTLADHDVLLRAGVEVLVVRFPDATGRASERVRALAGALGRG